MSSARMRTMLGRAFPSPDAGDAALAVYDTSSARTSRTIGIRCTWSSFVRNFARASTTGFHDVKQADGELLAISDKAAQSCDRGMKESTQPAKHSGAAR